MKKKDIEFLDVLSLRGPNIWTYRPVLEAWIDIGELEDFPSNTLPGFNERLSAWLPSLVEHRCSIGERGGFLQRLRDGTWMGHILEHVTLELQNLAGMQAGFGKAREAGPRGVYKVAIRARNETVSRAALNTARALLMAAIEDRPFDVAAAVAELRDMVDSHCLGPSTACIVDAATDRGIPSMRLNDGNLVQLGYGVNQRRIWTAETDQTSAIAEGISRDKDLTKQLLGYCGVPIPEGRLVDSPEDAWDAAEDIGLPVVVKPYDGNHGRGVCANLNSREEVMAAYPVARAEGSGVIVERFIFGAEHRLLVVGGKLAAAARGEEAAVVGDGRSTIVELINSQLNTDPRRGEEEEFPLTPILLEREPAARLELSRQGYDGQSIPPAGQRVLVQRNGNMTCDITSLVHPDVAAAAVLAARVVGLDIAGVDVVAEDISRPLAEQRGAIVEVNAGPGLLMHLKPEFGEPRPVGRAIVDSLFPAGNDGRIPVVAVGGTNGKTVVAQLVASLLRLSDKRVALSCSDGLYFDQRRIGRGDGCGWEAARKCLINRSIEAAVIESDSRHILGEGLAYDRCQVAVLTGIGAGDHLGDYYIEQPEQLFTVWRTLVDVVLPGGAAVLNAADPQLVEMAELCDGEVIYFARARNAVIDGHLAAGGRAVLLEDGQIVLAQGREQRQTLGVAADVPLSYDGRVGFQLDNLLAALAAAWALGLSDDLMRTGVDTFDVGQAGVPGRFTVFRRGEATVVVDDAHNADAMRALIEALDAFPAARRHAVCALGALRRSQDWQAQAAVLAAGFDQLTLTTDASLTVQATAEAQAAFTAALHGGRLDGCQRQDDPRLAISQALAALTGSADLLWIQTGEGPEGGLLALELARQWAGQA